MYFVIKRIQIGEDSEEREPPVCFLIWVPSLNFYMNNKIDFLKDPSITHKMNYIIKL